MEQSEKTLDMIVNLCKNRGYVFPGSEIYGGLANSWDYGPLGVEFKNNVKKAWLKKFVQESPYNVGLDAAIIMNPQTWVTTGHVSSFSDPLLDCRACKARHRADKLIGENGHLQPEDRSLTAASLKNIYKPLIASGYTAPCPTLGDLYRDLNKSNLRRAKQLALMLDVFANGSLQAFSHTTNVDMNNRLICFNIQSLGDQLRPIAMMSLLEFINMQVMTNRRKDATAATWIYFDEIHVLLKDPMSSNFLYSSWKRFRKYNAYATGISQDIQDYLDNPVAYALLSNSEFVIMLRQSKSLEALERLYGLSKPQLEFLCNASEGHGIIKMCNSVLPFTNLEPKDSDVYQLITTKPGERKKQE